MGARQAGSQRWGRGRQGRNGEAAGRWRSAAREGERGWGCTHVMMRRIIVGSAEGSSLCPNAEVKLECACFCISGELARKSCRLRTYSAMITVARCIAIFIAACRIALCDVGKCGSTSSRSARARVATST